VYNWTSCYLGGNVGGKWATFSRDVAVIPGLAGLPVFATVGHDSNTEAVYGGQVGCQWQSGSWVFGFEGDFDGTNLRRTFVAGPLVPAPFVPGDALEIKNDWQASIRGRIGYAWDRFLIYGTGGIAFANVEATLSLVPTVGLPGGLFASDSRTSTGWTVGAGFAYAIWDSVDVGVEYRYSQFDRDNFALGTLGGILPAGFTAGSRVETNEVTARLNWHFLFGGGPRL
jgi:outer membrane immunogenic protein